jgi:hypothetical protein
MDSSPNQAFHWESRLQYLEYAKKGRIMMILKLLNRADWPDW